MPRRPLFGFVKVAISIVNNYPHGASNSPYGVFGFPNGVIGPRASG
jgi:hypothetical protein